MAIDLSELTFDPDFCTTFDIERPSEPVWEKGRLTQTKTRFTVTGIANPANAEDLDLLEEGDRKHGIKTFHTAEAEFRISDTENLSDVVIWQGKRYKLLHVWDYTANGFSKALGEMLGSDDDGNDAGA